MRMSLVGFSREDRATWAYWPRDRPPSLGLNPAHGFRACSRLPALDPGNYLLAGSKREKDGFQKKESCTLEVVGKRRNCSHRPVYLASPQSCAASALPLRSDRIAPAVLFSANLPV